MSKFKRANYTQSSHERMVQAKAEGDLITPVPMRRKYEQTQDDVTATRCGQEAIAYVHCQQGTGEAEMDVSCFAHRLSILRTCRAICVQARNNASKQGIQRTCKTSVPAGHLTYLYKMMPRARTTYKLPGLRTSSIKCVQVRKMATSWGRTHRIAILARLEE